jgi:hypothetical protein
MGEYIPAAPVNDETRRRNGNLPGMGGIYNYVNLHAYHYAGNNPVKYVDPDGRDLQLVVSKSRGTMEITRTGYKYHIQFFGPRIISRHSINVITSVNSNFPGANTIASDKGRIQLSGEGKYTNPTQLPSNTTYSITEPPRAVMYGNKDGKYGTGEQGLLINAVQTLPGVNANNDLLEDITYQDSGYMIHITPYGYTNGCVGIWYDPNDKTGASKRRAIEQMNWLVDQYKNATKNGEKTSITIMD